MLDSANVTTTPRPIVKFVGFEFDLATGELRKAGMRIKLQEQPTQVLIALVERAGNLVTREDLRERLWAKDTFVDFDHSVTIAINKIRDALGDCATDPEYIETIPRRGYRFLPPVEGVGSPLASVARTSYRREFAIAALLALIVAIFAGWQILHGVGRSYRIAVLPL